MLLAGNQGQTDIIYLTSIVLLVWYNSITYCNLIIEHRQPGCALDLSIVTFFVAVWEVRKLDFQSGLKSSEVI